MSISLSRTLPSSSPSPSFTFFFFCFLPAPISLSHHNHNSNHNSNDNFNCLQQGFQGQAIANNGYATSASQYFPQYSAFAAQSQFPTNPFGGVGVGVGVGGNGQWPNSQVSSTPGQFSAFGSYPASFANYPSFAGSQMPGSASGPYPSYAQSGGVPTNGQGSPDFHNVLDSFVRNAGLSPIGGPGNSQHDQEVAASSIQAREKGQREDIPVFSFKKLYSFPFYLSSDNGNPSASSSDNGFNLQIPYMKRHIRRMSPAQQSQGMSDFERQQKHLQMASGLHQYQMQQAMHQNQLQRADYLASYIQQYLRENGNPLESPNAAFRKSNIDRSQSAGQERQGGNYREEVETRPQRQYQSPSSASAPPSIASVSDSVQNADSQEFAETQYQPTFAAYYGQQPHSSHPQHPQQSISGHGHGLHESAQSRSDSGEERGEESPASGQGQGHDLAGPAGLSSKASGLGLGLGLGANTGSVHGSPPSTAQQAIQVSSSYAMGAHLGQGAHSHLAGGRGNGSGNGMGHVLGPLRAPSS